jgi:hypothetical protein
VGGITRTRAAAGGAAASRLLRGRGAPRDSPISPRITWLQWPEVDLDAQITRPRSGSRTKRRGVLAYGKVPALCAIIKRRLDTPLVFHVDGRPMGDWRKRLARACLLAGLASRTARRRGSRSTSSCTTPAGPWCGTSGVRASPSGSPWRSPATRPARSSTATISSASVISRMPGPGRRVRQAAADRPDRGAAPGRDSLGIPLLMRSGQVVTKAARFGSRTGFVTLRICWCAQQDSNLRPSDS